MLRAGRYAEAATLLERLVAASPGSFDIYEDLGWAYLGVGRNRASEQAYLTSLRNLPEHAERLWGLAEALRRQGEYAEAIQAYERSLVQRPSMGETHMGLALAYAQLGDFPKAFEHTRRQVEINPASTIGLTNLAQLGIMVGEFDEAVRASELLLQLGPTDPSAHYARWNALNAAGYHEREVAALRESLELFPDEWMYVCRLAWRLAVSPGDDPDPGDEALRLAHRAVELKPDHARSLDTLAAAQASSGDYEEAVRTARHAVELASATAQSSLDEEIGNRISLYESGQPYRE
jgi:tetratricopeptide (TPR) repeat protein